VSGEFVVLGSGGFESCGPAARAPSGYALKLASGTLLFDLGFGCLRQLVRAGLSPEGVTHAFFTHRHPDHVGDLPALLFHLSYTSAPRSRKLKVFGPRGFAAFVERLSRAHHPWLRPRGYALSVQELEEGAVVSGEGFKVVCREVPHTTEALAYRLESREGSLCLSGDTAYDEGLAVFAAGAGLFVLECSLDGRSKTPGHLNVQQSIELGRRSAARRVLYSHLSVSSERALLRLKRLRRLRPGREGLAEDLLRIRLPRPGTRPSPRRSLP
jgi:ribonuclease BN (tRNA processing enzyme)